jgi:hypothetical protein
MMSLSWGAWPGIAVIAPVATAAQAAEAAQAGARLVDVGRAGELIQAVRAQISGVGICADGAGPGGEEPDVVRDAALAARSGACLICADTDTAADAVRAGIPAGRIAVVAAPAGIEAVRAAGWIVVADLEPWADSPVRVQAVAAVCVWLGASAIRTRYVTAVQRSVDMTESILGHRPPTRAVRGLA